MKGRYEIRHPKFGRGYRFTSLERARKEFLFCAGGNWYIYDRQEKQEVN